MTVAVETNKITYDCDGILTEFDFSFKVFVKGDLKVIITDSSDNETVLVITTDYTVSGSLESGGKITTVATWAAGNTITIELNMDFDQPTDLLYGGVYISQSVEKMSDRVVKMIQQLKALIDEITGGGGGGTISDEAYNAATWNAIINVGASKNALRDKFETLGSASTRDAEDAMSDGSDLPDGHAVKVYGDAHWGGGAGDVVGPASSIAEAIVLFDGVTGKLIKDSTRLIEDVLSDGSSIPDGHAIKVHGDANWAGDIKGPATHSADYILQWNSTPNSKVVVEGIPVTTEGKAILASALVKIFIQTEKDKLAAIEALADVTDATNVAAAGAVMDADFAAAHQLMKGTGAGTHDQLTVAASRIVGRAAAGNIDDLTAAQARTVLEFTSPILDKTTPGALGATTPGNIYSNYLKMTGEVSFVIQMHDDITGAQTVNWQSGNKHKMKFGAGNVTLTFTAPHYTCNLLLLIQQDSVGGRTITWPATVKWPGGVEPTLSTGALAIDIVSFFFSGSAYYGVASLDFS